MAGWRADLHVHTVLSGCAEVEMIPPLIVERARERGLNMIGITDHNSAANAWAVIEAAGGDPVVKPGLELESRETVHIVCLFDTVEEALELQAFVYEHLPSLPVHGEDPFGPRLLVDAEGREIGREARPLFAATDLSLVEAVGCSVSATSGRASRRGISAAGWLCEGDLTPPARPHRELSCGGSEATRDRT